MRIDFVSDVTCPWCAIGFTAPAQAPERLGSEIPAELHLQPFQLNAGMPPEGQDVVSYMARKYGRTPEQVAERQAYVRDRGAEVGFVFGPRTRTWNTFDAHRLLHWAGLEGRQVELKRALLAAYHTRGENPGSHEVLLRSAAAVGLDVERARAVLGSGEFADEVREQERRWRALGIDSVPSLVIDGKHLIQGGQPVEVFERALREIAEGRQAA